VRANDTFMASSTTKVITATAILQLVEREKIRLDDPASRYTEHPYGDGITIRHLLAQTSGIPNPLPLRWIHRASEHAGFDENAAFHETVQRHSKLLFTPGTRYAYSNISYWILGRSCVFDLFPVISKLCSGEYP
jgi:CubicO group peptidase (beta-lactamase class C family)